MFAVVGFVSIFCYQAKRLAGKNVSEITYFVSSGMQNHNSVNQSRLPSISTLGRYQLMLFGRVYEWLPGVTVWQQISLRSKWRLADHQSIFPIHCTIMLDSGMCSMTP